MDEAILNSKKSYPLLKIFVHLYFTTIINQVLLICFSGTKTLI